MSAPQQITRELLATLPLPPVTAGSDKDARGRVLVIAGSREVPGAALLAAEAALRVGAGKLQVAAPASVAGPLAIALPEARVFALEETPAGEIAAAGVERVAEGLTRCDAVLLGPGMIDEAAAEALAGRVLALAEGPCLVLDAAAMSGLQGQAELARRHAGRLMLTPHAGEMATLAGSGRDEIEADPLAAARDCAAGLQAVVALKGGDTVIATPEGGAWIYRDGPVGLATSGSGDVLAGLVTGLLARGAPPATAAAWGVWLHGEAGLRLSRRIGRLGFLARELAPEVPAILQELEQG